MNISFDRSYVDPFVDKDSLRSSENKKIAAFNHVKKGDAPGAQYLGWTTLPMHWDGEELMKIKSTALEIQKKCDVFLVIGVGGSYLGSRAAIDFCKTAFYNSLASDTPKIYFLGNNLSADYVNNVLSLCEGHDVCINVISKSGSTVEPAIGFLLALDFMLKKYGQEAYSRIYVTTDPESGILLEFAKKHGCTTFYVPQNIGGRYSVLTAVGLLPIAVSGCDVEAMLRGAKRSCEKYFLGGPDNNDCLDFALYRNLIYNSGKQTEVFISYDPDVVTFGEWWKQLFGESEGKQGKGVMPASALFSTDLHSFGQYIQEGKRSIFETTLRIEKPTATLTVPAHISVNKLEYLKGKELSQINDIIFRSAAEAHRDASVPNLVLSVERKCEESFGALVYFFELSCAFSAYMLEVNPFNQPGVEAYKKYMRDYLSE